jgi:hypothetical protein
VQVFLQFRFGVSQGLGRTRAAERPWERGWDWDWRPIRVKDWYRGFIVFTIKWLNVIVPDIYIYIEFTESISWGFWFWLILWGFTGALTGVISEILYSNVGKWQPRSQCLSSTLLKCRWNISLVTTSGKTCSYNLDLYWLLIIKDDVHSCAHARTLFTFWTAIFVKYDILTEYLTLFWFAIILNEYKLYVSVQKSSEDAKFGQCLYLGVPLCYEQNWCAERSGHHL